MGPQQNQPQSGGTSNNSGKKMGKLRGQYAPKPATSGDCGRFPSVNLRAITDEDQVEDHANYNDPQDMNTCLFKVNHPPHHGPDTKLSPHFQIKEFASKDGAKYMRLSQTLIQCLELMRGVTGALTINSGYRTVSHNKNENGRANSYHLSG